MTADKWIHNRWMATASAIFLLLALCACGSGNGGDTPVDPPPPPVDHVYNKPADTGDGWVTAHAEDLGVSVPVLEDMMNAMAANFDIVDSIAVAYRGQLILDETIRTQLNEFDGMVNNVDLDMHNLWSVSKSLASLAIGVAIEQGVIDDIDVPYLSLFPYVLYANWDERKDDIRLEDVLTMRLGFDWDEWDPPYFTPGNALSELYESSTDYSKALLDLPVAHDPGTTFAYSTPASVSLGQAIENAGPLALIEFGFANIFQPLGIVNVEVTRTPTGLPDLGSGLYLVARDLLKFGQLYVDRGQWNGETVVSETWIDASTQAHVPLAWSDPDRFDWKLTGYGYQWWIGYFEVDGRQVPAYAGRGYGQQWLYVIPELELTVVIFSHAWDEEADEVNQAGRLMSEFVIPALPAS